MMAMIFPAILFGILWLISSIRFGNSFKKFSAQQLSMIEQEIPSCKACEGVLVTSQAIVSKKIGLQLIPIKDLLWIYEIKTTVKLYGLIPVHKDSVLILADRNHKQYSFKIKNKGNAFSFVRSELLKFKQDIVFGYDYGLEDIYKKDIDRMIAFAQECEEERRKEMQGDVL